MYISRPLVLTLALAAVTGCSNGLFDSAVIDQPFSAELQCGQLPISVQGQGESLQLQAGGEQLQLTQAVSASGARYLAEGEPETSLWFKGEQATLVLRGKQYPRCAPAGAIIEPFRASGNEPFWSLSVEQGQMPLSRLNEGELAPQGYRAGDSSGEWLSDGQPQIRLQLSDQLCEDSMSGMSYPQQVRVQVEGKQLEGCGGNTARLLQGGEWVVEDINGGGIIDRSRVTLNFGEDGRIHGRSSCNNYMGQYQLSGEGLSIGPLAGTRMACPPSLMEQEQRVLKNLEAVQRFEFDQTGALLLHSAEGTLKARLEH